jgi:hypothetical protein
MSPQEFDALVSSGTGFYTQNQMVSSGINNQLTQQALQNVQAMQVPVATGNAPQAAVSPVFERMAQERKELEAQFFVLLNGEQKGPLTLEQLKGLALVDVINESTQVWRQGTPAWTDLKTCLANI